MPLRIGLGRVTLGQVEGNVLNFATATLLIVGGRLSLL